MTHYRRSGRFATILNFNCKHLLFVKQKHQKIRELYKTFRRFSNFLNSNFVRGKFLKIRPFTKCPWDHVRSHKNNPKQTVYFCPSTLIYDTITVKFCDF